MQARAIRLTGDRIALREFDTDDWSAVHGWTSRPEVCRYQPWGPDTPEETRTYLQGVIEATARLPRTEYTLAAALRESDELIGSGSLWLRDEASRAGEIGYFVHPGHWGQGLGTEIARMLLRYGFERCHLHRIYATCDPRNAGSKRVLEKVGMTHEGRLRHTMLIRDGWRDSDVYGILEHEWEAAAHKP